MKYLGGKHLIGKEISQHIHENCPPERVKGYMEPFCGSLGVFKHMAEKGYDVCIASDNHPDLIMMWKKIQEETLYIPEEISKETYYELKKAESPDAMKAVAGFGLSFGGKYFGGYSQQWSGNSRRNYLLELKRSLDKIAHCIRRPNIMFEHKSYEEWDPQGMLIYCDPPYRFTESYTTGDFDHMKFWETMRRWSMNNCVFVSEENAPDDFKIVWEKAKRRTLDKKHRFYRYERLYQYMDKELGELRSP